MDAAVISKDQLGAELAKQITTPRDDVSLLIQESTKPLQASLDSLPNSEHIPTAPHLSGVINVCVR